MTGDEMHSRFAKLANEIFDETGVVVKQVNFEIRITRSFDGQKTAFTTNVEIESSKPT